jgi:hypothetical protein
MKAVTKILVFTIGLSLINAGCAYFRPPDVDPRVADMQRAEQEGIPQSEKALSSLIGGLWTIPNGVRIH